MSEDGTMGFGVARRAMAKDFAWHPYSVIDTRAKGWQQRKQWWTDKGVWGQEGRGDDGRMMNVECFTKEKYGHYEHNEKMQVPTSVFDPFLAECMYEWFCPPDGHVLDPFGGEMTKGAVAGFMGIEYTGMELREEQVQTNRTLSSRLPLVVQPKWVVGDSMGIYKELNPNRYDMVFTSPPYYNLEEYKGGKKDGSGFGTYEEFMDWYWKIFWSTVSLMKENSFLVIKVGEVRDHKTGSLYNFVGDNMSGFQDLGLHYWNEIILYQPVGTLGIRTRSQFPAGRKVGRQHQTVLVFWKGDPKQVNPIWKKIMEDKGYYEDISTIETADKAGQG